MRDSYRDDIWCAAYIMNSGCGDDGFDYFRYWLISRGKNAFYKAIANPDSLAEITEVSEEFEFEDFGYIANNAFEENTGKDVYDYMDLAKAFGGPYPKLDFTWEEENPQSMKAICPKLFDKFWDN